MTAEGSAAVSMACTNGAYQRADHTHCRGYYFALFSPVPCHCPCHAADVSPTQNEHEGSPYNGDAR